MPAVSMGKNLLTPQKLAKTKSASKRAIKKTAEATGYLVENRIADKIARLPSSKSTTTTATVTPLQTDEGSLEIPRENYIPPHKRQQIIHKLRLLL